MTAIRAFDSDEALDPGAIRILVSAYERALKSVTASDADRPAANSTREALAEYIMGQGLRGERDADRLYEGALASLRRRATSRRLSPAGRPRRGLDQGGGERRGRSRKAR